MLLNLTWYFSLMMDFSYELIILAKRSPEVEKTTVMKMKRTLTTPSAKQCAAALLHLHIYITIIQNFLLSKMYICFIYRIPAIVLPWNNSSLTSYVHCTVHKTSCSVYCMQTVQFIHCTYAVTLQTRLYT